MSCFLIIFNISSSQTCVNAKYDAIFDIVKDYILKIYFLRLNFFGKNKFLFVLS